MSAIKIATFFTASVVFAFGTFSTVHALNAQADAMCNPYFEQCPCGKVPKVVNGKQTCVDGGGMKANTHGCPVGVCFDNTSGHITSGICIQANKCQGVTCDGKPCEGQNLPYTNESGQQCFTGMTQCFDMSDPPTADTSSGTGADTSGTGQGGTGGGDASGSGGGDGYFGGSSEDWQNIANQENAATYGDTGGSTGGTQTEAGGSIFDGAFDPKNWGQPTPLNPLDPNSNLTPNGFNSSLPGSVTDLLKSTFDGSAPQGSGNFFQGGDLPPVSPSTGFESLPQSPLDNSVWESVNNVVGPVLTGLEYLFGGSLFSSPAPLSGGFPSASDFSGVPSMSQNQAPQGTPVTDSARATVYYPGGCTTQPGCSPGIEGGKYGDRNNLLSKTTPTVAAGPSSGLKHGDIVELTNNKTGQSTYAVVGDKCPGCGSGIDLTPAGMKAVGGITEANVSVEKIGAAANYSEGVKIVDQMNGQNFANWQNSGFLNNVQTAYNPNAVIQNASLTSGEMSWVTTGSGSSISPITSTDWTMGGGYDFYPSESTFDTGPVEPYPTTPVQAGPSLAEPYPTIPVQAGPSLAEPYPTIPVQQGPSLAEPYPTTPVTSGNLPPADPWGSMTDLDWQKLALNENLAGSEYFNGAPQDWAETAKSPADLDTLSPEQLRDIQNQQLQDRLAQAPTNPPPGPTTPLEAQPVGKVETGVGPLEPHPVTPVEIGAGPLEPQPTKSVETGPSLNEPYPSGIVTSENLPPLPDQPYPGSPWDESGMAINDDYFDTFSKNEFFPDYFSSNEQWPQVDSDAPVDLGGENGTGDTFEDRFRGTEGPTDLGDLTQEQLQKYADALSKGLEPITDPDYLSSDPERSFAERFPSDDAFNPTPQENAGQNAEQGKDSVVNDQQDGSGTGETAGCKSESCAGGQTGSDPRSEQITPEQEEIQRKLADAEAARDKLVADLNKLPQSANTQRLIGQAKAGLESLSTNSPDPKRLAAGASAMKQLESIARQTGDVSLAREIRAYNNQLASLNSQFEQYKVGQVSLGQLANGRDSVVANGTALMGSISGANLPGQITGMRADFNGRIDSFNGQIDYLKSQYYGTGLSSGNGAGSLPVPDSSWTNFTYETAGGQALAANMPLMDWAAQAPSSGQLGNYDYFAGQNAFVPSGGVSIPDNPFVSGGGVQDISPSANQYVGQNWWPPILNANQYVAANWPSAAPLSGNEYVAANWPTATWNPATPPSLGGAPTDASGSMPGQTTPVVNAPLPTARPGEGSAAQNVPLPQPRPGATSPVTGSPSPTLPSPSPSPTAYPTQQPGGYQNPGGLSGMWYMLGYSVGQLINYFSNQEEQNPHPQVPIAPTTIPALKATSTLSTLIVASPNPVPLNTSAHISWNSLGAEHCQIHSSLSSGAVASGVRGTLESAALASSTVYTVTCVSDIGAIASSSVTLTVQ